MKTKWCVRIFLVLVLCADFQLHAQQDDAAKQKFEETKIKAEAGDTQSQIDLAGMYYKGEGVTKDPAEADKWYHKAADLVNANKDALDNYSRGVRYATGDDVAKDSAEAVRWYRKAAEQGNAQAQCNLGVMYANGDGVAKDSAEAVRWYRKAAEQGEAAAQYQLGRRYYFGDGILVDYAEAVKWNALAAAQGDQEAVKMWNYVLKEKVPAEQIAEGQRRAAAFKPSIAAQTSSSSLTSDKQVAEPQATASGTGFFITDDGFLVTCAHVVQGANQVRLVTSAGTVSAKVIRVDSATDLALLKARGQFKPLLVAASRGVKLGGTVATVGFPNIGLQGFAPKLAKGEIASLSGAGDDARYFQISVPVQPGNSGGALVDERGNVVGVVSAKLSAKAALESSGSLPENVNYAVKSSFLLSFLESVPEVSAKLREPETKEAKFEDVVKSAQDAAVLVLIY